MHDLADAETLVAKAELASQIGAMVRERKLTQPRAASTLGIDRTGVARLVGGQLSGFSIQQLAHFLTLRRRDVEIVVREKPVAREVGHLTVNAA